MEVKFGIQHATRELALEIAAGAEDVERAVVDALSAGSDGLVKLTDDKGRRVLIPAERLAYVEIDVDSTRQIGFGQA